MSRTWKREPIRRNRDEYIEMDHYGAIQRRLAKRKEPILCLVGTIDDTVTDAMMSGDSTFVRRVEHV